MPPPSAAAAPAAAAPAAAAARRCRSRRRCCRTRPGMPRRAAAPGGEPEEPAPAQGLARSASAVCRRDQDPSAVVVACHGSPLVGVQVPAGTMTSIGSAPARARPGRRGRAGRARPPTSTTPAARRQAGRIVPGQAARGSRASRTMTTYWITSPRWEMPASVPGQPVRRRAEARWPLIVTASGRTAARPGRPGDGTSAPDAAITVKPSLVSSCRRSASDARQEVVLADETGDERRRRLLVDRRPGSPAARRARRA